MSFAILFMLLAISLLSLAISLLSLAISFIFIGISLNSYLISQISILLLKSRPVHSFLNALSRYLTLQFLLITVS